MAVPGSCHTPPNTVHAETQAKWAAGRGEKAGAPGGEMAACVGCAAREGDSGWQHCSEEEELWGAGGSPTPMPKIWGPASLY